jgi:hypothetical protein
MGQYGPTSPGKWGIDGNNGNVYSVTYGVNGRSKFDPIQLPQDHTEAYGPASSKKYEWPGPLFQSGKSLSFRVRERIGDNASICGYPALLGSERFHWI